MSLPSTQNTEFLTLAQLIAAAWRGKWVIVGVTFVAALVSVWASLNMANQYYSEAVLAPRIDDGFSNMQGQLGGLASLAGINLGQGSGDKTEIALAVLKSRQFTTNFIREHNIAPFLVAATGWDPQSDKVLIDPEIYDESSATWVRNVEFPYTQIPSDWELFDRFTQILQLDRETDSGMVRVGIEFYSPYLTQQWVSWLVDDINLEMRNRDAEQAERSIDYLQQELENAQVENVKNLFFSLIEEQLKTKMLTDVTPQYAFTVVDPPVSSLLKSAPKRSLIVILVTFLAGFLATIAVVIFYTSGHSSKTYSPKGLDV